MGSKVVVDTSGPALAAALDEGIFLVKPNLRELEELVGATLSGRRDWLAASRNLIVMGKTEMLALTLGSGGALLVTRDQALYAPAIQVEAVSTIGAGDSFLGGMVWALDGGRSIEESFRYGVAAGAAALLTPGTGLCQRKDVKRLVSTVTLEAV
jgi:6-phosphofructokinase 2